MSVDRAVLAKIHIAKKELGLSDDLYRSILQTRYKKDSAAKLSRFEAGDLVEHFKGQGFKVKRIKKTSLPANPASTASPSYEEPMMRKIVAIWITLAQAGVVKNGSDKALQSYVKRMTGVENLAWCGGRDLYLLIEGLKKWAKREDVNLD